MDIQINNKINSFKEITNNIIKTNLINTIYNELSVSNLRYQLLDKNIDFLRKDIFYVTPHIIGIPCWLIFCEINEIKYKIIINKKDLKYYANQMIPNQIKISIFEYDNKSDESRLLYPLTVFEGRFINSLNENNQQVNLTYLISDIYIYGGKKILTKKLPDKIIIIEKLLPILNSGLDNNFNIKLAGIYDMEQLGDLIFNKIKNSKLKINGLIFLPERSGKTFIYINDNDFSNLKNKVPNDIICKEYSSLSVPAIPIQMSVKNQLDTDLVNTFVIRKTNITDVFELYNYVNKEKLYLNLTKDNRIGIAHIPDMKTSHYCKMMGDKNEIFANKCIFNTKFKKWMPYISDMESIINTD